MRSHFVTAIFDFMNLSVCLLKKQEDVCIKFCQLGFFRLLSCLMYVKRSKGCFIIVLQNLRVGKTKHEYKGNSKIDREGKRA